MQTLTLLAIAAPVMIVLYFALENFDNIKNRRAIDILSSKRRYKRITIEDIAEIDE